MSLRKKIKRIGRKSKAIGAKVLSVAAPLAGAVFFGPAGAAAGTALGTAASRFGAAAGARAKGKRGREARHAGRKAAKRAAVVGGAITAGTAAISLAGGGGLTEGLGKVLGVFGSRGPASTPGVLPEDPVSILGASPAEAAGEEPVEETVLGPESAAETPASGIDAKTLALAGAGIGAILLLRKKTA